jgi:hypothetical protein
MKPLCFWIVDDEEYGRNAFKDDVLEIFPDARVCVGEDLFEVKDSPTPDYLIIDISAVAPIGNSHHAYSPICNIIEAHPGVTVVIASAVGRNYALDVEEDIKRVKPDAMVVIPEDRGGHYIAVREYLRTKALESHGSIDGAIDLINDAIDELFRRGQFALCDYVLAETNPMNYSTDILLAILTATAAAKSRLEMRQRFFAASKKAIKARKEYELGLLDGLE